VAFVLLVSGAAGACSGGLERSSSPCPDGQELREERYDSTSISARGCVGKDSENNYRREGRWEYFYPSGQKQAEGSYVDGFQGEEGRFAGFRIDGDGREGPWVLWYENGQKSGEGSYRDGKEEGPYTSWYDNGQKEAEGSYRDGKEEGLYTSWYDNGQKSEESNYRDGKLEGLSTIWWDNGQKEAEVTYRDGTRTSGTEWNESGNQIRAD
jgi:antitoxin component YwqK of YwqJK toxin-antitoxin module